MGRDNEIVAAGRAASEASSANKADGRLKWMNYRGVSAICYLNEEWDLSDGGCLRVLNPDNPDRSRDNQNCSAQALLSESLVVPRLGTMVFFDSKTVQHEVLPTHKSGRLTVT